MATIQAINNGDSGLAARTKINNNDANINAALAAAEALLVTDNPNLDDFQKITDEIEAIQATLSVNDAAYDTLQKIVDKLKTAETKLATIQTGAEVNVQSDWDESDNTNDAFIQNKPALGTASTKDVGTAVGKIQENGAILGNSQTVETDSTGKFITVAKNTAYNANFGTGNADIARGDASYLKAHTYTQTEINNALATAASNKTGTIVMSIASSLSGALKFDGVSSYSKSTYSSLYTILNNIIGSAFDVDANNFYLPDPAGRVLGVAGAGTGLTARTLFDIVGAENHILLINEIPSHTHPFALNSNGASGGGIRAGVSVPFITNDPPNLNAGPTYATGGGGSHNNMQPTFFAGNNLFIYF